MNRFAIVAATALMLGSTANAAEPAPANPRPVAEPATPRAPVLMASATTTSVPTAEQAAGTPPPVKKRAARVTSCRCGEASPR